MIREILSSDVEFAKGMLASSHSDAEVLAYLASRGIDSAKAAELLNDLRHGRTPDTPLTFVPSTVGHPAAANGAAPKAGILPAPDHRRRGTHRRRSHRQSGIPWWFLLLAVIFILALGYAFLEMGSDASTESVNKAKHVLPAPLGK